MCPSRMRLKTQLYKQNNKAMKTLRFFGMVLTTILLSAGFTACSSDDSENNNGGSNGKVGVPNVFTGGQPKSIAGMSMTYNSDGTLASISDNSTRATFEYGSGARAVAANTVRMTIYDDEELFATCDLVLNSSGFVKSCTETDYEGDVETWEFGYNSDGQLNYMKRSEGGNEVTNITYQGGNIVKTTVVSEEDPNESYECTVNYGEALNKGCIMLFDETLGIDMDEMEYAYYAGLLGKATKNLPKSSVDEDGDATNYTWTLNDNGLPTKMIATDSYGYNESYTFSW